MCFFLHLSKANEETFNDLIESLKLRSFPLKKDKKCQKKCISVIIVAGG